MILLRPNDKKRQFQSLNSLSAIEPPLWLTIIANLYDNVQILDAEAENLSFEETLVRCRGKEVLIFPTGNHPSAQIQQMDMALQFTKALPKCQIKDKFWFDPTQYNPRYELIDHSLYRSHNWHSWTNDCKRDYGVIFNSVSCPYACSFCSVRNWYNQPYKLRSTDRILIDLEYYATHGIKNIKIMDELFITRSKRTEEILDILSDFDFNIWAYARLDTINPSLLPKIKKAGINWLGIGIESGNREIRRMNDKGDMTNFQIIKLINQIQDNGISVGANYIFGFPEDTPMTMHHTLCLAKELNCEYSNFYSMMDYTTHKEPLEYAQYGYECCPTATEHLSSKDILQFRDNAFKEYYTSPKYLNMMKIKFGAKVIQDITSMTNKSIKRKLYATIKDDR